MTQKTISQYKELLHKLQETEKHILPEEKLKILKELTAIICQSNRELEQIKEDISALPDKN